MKDASVVTRKTLVTAALAVAADAANGNVLAAVAAREPLLAAYITERMQNISGKLALSGAPPEVVQAFFEDIGTIVATSVRTAWVASDELWEGVDLALLARPRRARRHRGSAGAAAAPTPLSESGDTGTMA